MFWELRQPENAIAIIDTAAGRHLTYGNLHEKVTEFLHHLNEHAADEKQLGFIYANNSVESVTAYLAALQRGDAVVLLNSELTRPLKDELEKVFDPEWVFDGEFHRQRSRSIHPIHSDLAVMLSTSGTTGSQKFVRLSRTNLNANAASIAEFLGINPSERAITTLPLAYSYGLSVLNSHLMQGASLILTSASIINRAFWEDFRKYAATSFSGVPYTYKMLHRLKFHKMDLPSLRSYTQAGGRLAVDLVEYFLNVAQSNGYRFTVMYGQTEATARMSHVPFERLGEKLGSIGVAIPGGKLSLHPESHELLYQGSNVMMGYAECRADLAKGDELQGALQTGDLASVDSDGFYTIVGRMKRFIKVFGLRINLDDVEQMLEREVGVHTACVGRDELLRIVIAGHPNLEIERMIRSKIRELYKLHHSSFQIRYVDDLPIFPNGKLNYGELEAEVGV